ncbi:hypothetical protein ACU4GH_18630 [Bradyrhizobium betae]
MSLIATSLTKSAVEGATPSAELTPVFSPSDWASAGPAKSTQARAMMVRFMVKSLNRVARPLAGDIAPTNHAEGAEVPNASPWDCALSAD